ncbi:MAG TPA: rRNA maturation RNase YbeY [Pyrinomonadaceae bacterium]|jgi:probable rRNA maturation factor|nr:rRNA maturation RNase YbeY [Pyrinomonadaceae bacterium]
MVEVVNRQRRLKLDTEAWSNFAALALDAIGKSESSATIAFVSDKRIRELNRQFRGVDKATDVLSFPAEEKLNLGDVAVSVDTAAVQAKDHGLSFDDEIAQLILHGLLHLCGYDHETDNGEMNRLELKLRRKLKI